MAPYVGPTLAALLPLLKKGLRDTVALGHGVPRATLQRVDGGFELRRLSGGAGFGVQADLVSPFVDEGVLARTADWPDMFAWLCEHWDESWGRALDKTERVRVTFANQSVVAKTLDDVAGACRAARTAHAQVDFALVRVKVVGVRVRGSLRASALSEGIINTSGI